MKKIVFVWIGDVFPDWARISIGITGRTSGLDLILLTSRSVGKIAGVAKQIFLEDFYNPSNIISYTTYNPKFRNGFWLKTSERFFVLRDYMKYVDKSPFFHAELDNIVFNISELSCKLDLIGSGFFCPRDSVNRGIASLIYINSLNCIDEFINEYLKTKIEKKNDMDVLGVLLQNSPKFFSLPTEELINTNQNPILSTMSINQTGGIFDAASIGQFLFGIDPRNQFGRLYNCFQNSNRGCDLWGIEYQMDLKRGVCNLISTSSNINFNLYNLHVHSKLFSLISDDNFLEKLLKNTNLHKKTLMNNSLNFNFLYNKLINKIKNLNI